MYMLEAYIYIYAFTSAYPGHRSIVENRSSPFPVSLWQDPAVPACVVAGELRAPPGGFLKVN